MVTMFGAAARAARDLARPRVLAILVLPMTGALLLWSVLALFFWSAWTAAVVKLVEDSTLAIWLASHGMRWTLETLVAVFVGALVLAAVVLTAIAITELVAMPLLVSVAASRYPALAKARGGTLAGSVANATFAALAFVLLWLVTLPLWLTGIGAILVPALNAAYLNQRLFRYDALSEHATREEYAAIVERARLRLFGLGLLLAPLYYVPVVNLAAPVFAGLAFSHLCLAELAELRRSA